MLIQRFFKVVQSFLHAFVNKIQDPILMAEQAMRDLKKDFDSSMNNLAEIKSLSIETKNKIAEQTQIAKEYEKKALTILQKAQAGELEQANADRLASEALKKKQNAIENIKKFTLDAKNYDAMAEKLESKIATIKEQIISWESEIKTLKARHKVAITSKKMSKQLISMSNNNAQALLQSMKEKVDKEEAMAQAYDEMNLIETDIDKEINEAIGVNYSNEVQQSLIELKKQIAPKYLITQKEKEEKE
ncbi:MAG: PspA/IM30 family protein [Candidatus Gastranaerophilales bacterium]|nr:PspA/IM30 family protein [Candidatus Gastranaerophilales bacterium]